MFSNYNKWVVLRQFFIDPNSLGQGFQWRELCRLTQLSPKSVLNYLQELIREELVVKSKTRSTGYPVYFANRSNERFRFLKKINTIMSISDLQYKKLKKTLLDYVVSECSPDVVVLFGSASRGEDLLDSDIDLFVQSKEKELKNLDFFEKLLKRKINLFFKSDFNALSSELKNNIINGNVLYGHINIKFH
ncbi:MAG: nucleotidyltransferase domain-containing protein [Candidatus Diapherotrites archaeon]|nr:nucleotidyltransferase domain-containing protein [Candidatus Diapherotrites archaeon]